MTDVFIRVIEMSITASIVIGVVMVMRLLLRKAPKVFSYVLWAAALFRLLCPISFELPSAPIPSVEIPYSSEVIEGNENQFFITYYDKENAHAPELSAPQTEVSQQVTAVSEPVSETPVKREINYIAIVSYIWALAVIIMAFRGVASWVKLSRSLRSAQKMGGNVYVSTAISDPFIMGIVRPKIYLPTGLNCTESDLIIRHEKAHMHRGDHIAKLVMYAALCIHCFNPLVWVMFRLFERDMEMSCDEKVTANMTKEQKADYSQTLLKISAKPTAAFTACFGENGTKQRIKNVLSFKKPALWVAIILTLAAAAVSVILCANRYKEDTQIVGEYDTIQSTDAFSAKMKFISSGESNDEYAIDCVITNLTSDELAVDLSHFFSLCYSSNIVSPVSFGSTDEYTFAPNESKSFVFDVQKELVGDIDDTKEINGSCVLEITNSDKYEYYNVMRIDPYFIENNGFPELFQTMGINGKQAYMRRADYYGEHNDEYERHSETVTDEEKTKQYREQLYPEYGEAIEQCIFVCEYFLVPLYDETGENVVDYYRSDCGVTPILPDGEELVILAYENGETEMYPKPLPSELMSACDSYLTYYWSYITQTGELDSNKFTTDKDMAELIEAVKSKAADTVSSGIDKVEVEIANRNVNYGTTDDTTWVYIGSYTVNWLRNGEITNTQTGYNAYFEFKDTDGSLDMVCEIDLWRWHKELGIDPEPYEFPLDIDVSEAAKKIYAAQGHLQDMDMISEMGLPDVIDNCESWDMFFFSDVWIDTESLLNTVEIDGVPYYSEYRIKEDMPQFMPNIEKVLGVQLELAEGYYKFPFTTVEEVKKNAQRLFSDKYIEAVFNNFTQIKEYNGSLYAQLGGRGNPGGWIANAYIYDSSDSFIDFSATFVDSFIGTYSRRYKMIKEDGSWKINEIDYID